jgi:uncharacterized protein (DUF2141 family)
MQSPFSVPSTTRRRWRQARKPKQGYGFSNNPASTFGPPGFDSAAFTYKGGTLHLPVRLSY